MPTYFTFAKNISNLIAKFPDLRNQMDIHLFT